MILSAALMIACRIFSAVSRSGGCVRSSLLMKSTSSCGLPLGTAKGSAPPAAGPSALAVPAAAVPSRTATIAAAIAVFAVFAVAARRHGRCHVPILRVPMVSRLTDPTIDSSPVVAAVKRSACRLSPCGTKGKSHFRGLRRENRDRPRERLLAVQLDHGCNQLVAQLGLIVLTEFDRLGEADRQEALGRDLVARRSVAGWLQGRSRRCNIRPRLPHRELGLPAMFLVRVALENDSLAWTNSRDAHCSGGNSSI